MEGNYALKQTKKHNTVYYYRKTVTGYSCSVVEIWGRGGGAQCKTPSPAPPTTSFQEMKHNQCMKLQVEGGGGIGQEIPGH